MRRPTGFVAAALAAVALAFFLWIALQPPSPQPPASPDRRLRAPETEPATPSDDERADPAEPSPQGSTKPPQPKREGSESSETGGLGSGFGLQPNADAAGSDPRSAGPAASAAGPPAPEGPPDAGAAGGDAESNEGRPAPSPSQAPSLRDLPPTVRTFVERNTSRDDRGLVAKKRPSGGVGIDLKEGFQSVPVATVDEDGNVIIHEP